MRTQIATVLSIAGVMAAGAGAYAVNSTVLSAPSASPIAISSTVPTNAASGQVAQAGASDAASLVPSADNETTPEAQTISSTTTTYQVGKAGSVVVDTSGGNIVVTSIAPAAGWTSEPARTQSDGSVKVHFVSSSSRFEFIAKMTNGKVMVSVLTDDVMSSQPITNPPAPRHDDDDDHHEYEHEDGDDD